MRLFSLFLALFSAALLAAQTEKRLALVVGNAKYANNPLANPANDARDMAAVLRLAGFTVTEKYDQSYDALNNLVTDFARSIKDPNAVALFYYAGHGVQYGGTNYLVPIGADNLGDENEIEWRCVPLDRITSKMQDAGNRLNIIVLDACRTFPVARGTRKLQNGLIEAGGSIPELLIAYATAPGKVAADRSEGQNGLFTATLLRHLRTPGYDLHKVFLETRKDVKSRTDGKQVPGVMNNVTVDFYFFPPLPPAETKPVVSTETKPQPKKPDDDFGDDVVEDDSLHSSPRSIENNSYSPCPYCPVMVSVTGGKFRMGRETDNTEGEADEQPAHHVTVPDFEIGKYEVTNREFCYFLNGITSKITLNKDGEITYEGNIIFDLYCNGQKVGGCEGFTEMIEYDNGNVAGGEFTVKKGYENYACCLVTWYGAKAYSGWLNKRLRSKKFRLPSESEWEYAARGGSLSKGYKYSGSNDVKEVAWFDDTAKGKKQFGVGQKKANEIGLHDMSGSLWEWVEDCHNYTYAGAPRDGSAWVENNCSHRVRRGGSWGNLMNNVRPLERLNDQPKRCNNSTGFRLARSK